MPTPSQAISQVIAALTGIDPRDEAAAEDFFLRVFPSWPRPARETVAYALICMTDLATPRDLEKIRRYLMMRMPARFKLDPPVAGTRSRQTAVVELRDRVRLGDTSGRRIPSQTRRRTSAGPSGRVSVHLMPRSLKPWPRSRATLWPGMRAASRS